MIGSLAHCRGRRLSALGKWLGCWCYVRHNGVIILSYMHELKILMDVENKAHCIELDLLNVVCYSMILELVEVNEKRCAFRIPH